MPKRLTPEERSERERITAEKAAARAARTAAREAAAAEKVKAREERLKAQEERKAYWAAKEAQYAAEEEEAKKLEQEEKERLIAKFEASYDQEIARLLRDETIDKEPSLQAKKKIFIAFREKADDGIGLEELIPECCPGVMSEGWKEEARETKRFEREMADQYDREHRMAKYAPEIKIEQFPRIRLGESRPTENQVNYLRRLGVRNEEVLANISFENASKLIDAAKEERLRKGIDRSAGGSFPSTPSRSQPANSIGVFGWLLLLGLVVAVVFILKSIAKH